MNADCRASMKKNAFYVKGLTTRDIQDIVQELYGVEVSATLVHEPLREAPGTHSTSSVPFALAMRPNTNNKSLSRFK
jgi:hypothetical protein